MNNFLHIIFSLSLSGSFLILILLACRPLLKNRLSKRWQYYIWLAVIARLLLPFSPEVSLTGALLHQADQTITQIASAWETRTFNAAPSANTNGFSSNTGLAPSTGQSDAPTPIPEPNAPSAASVLSYLWLIWLGGALLILLRKITLYQSFTRCLRAGCTEVSDPALLDLLAETGAQCGVKRPVELYENPLAASPMLLGLFRPRIVLPTAALPQEEFIYTVRHELIHCRRQDLLYKWLTQITICLHWFNPLVWLMGYEIGRACELSCDEAVLAQLDSPSRRAYGDTLLHAVRVGGNYQNPPVSVTLQKNGKLLKERLDAIMKFKKTTKWTTALSAVLTAALLFSATAAGAYSGPSDAAAGAHSNPNDNAAAVQKGGNDAPRFYYIMDTYYEPPYLFEIGWNMQETTDNSYLHRTVTLADGSAMTVLFSSACADLPQSTGAMQSLAALLTHLRAQQQDTLYPLTRPLVVSAQYIGGASPAALAEQYYQEDALPQFGAVFGQLGETAQSTWLENIYADDEISFFSVAIKTLKTDAPLIKHFAEKAYNDNNASFFSVLINYMSEKTLQEWTAQAEADGKTAFRSILYSAQGKDLENDAMKAELEKQRQEEYRAQDIVVDGAAYYYKNQLVRIFLDQRPDYSFSTLSVNPKGVVDLRILRDADGKITGVAYLTEAEADALLCDMDDPDTWEDDWDDN